MSSDSKDAAASNAQQPIPTATTIAPQQVVSQIVQTYQQQGGVKPVTGVTPAQVSNTQNPFVSYLNQQASVQMAVSNAMTAVTGTSAQVPGINYQAIQGGQATSNDLRLQ